MPDNMTPLASLSVTHVFYDPEDPVSLVCAYLALLPQSLCIVYATLILSTREIEIALMFLGQLGCEALNFILKRLIKEERPRRIHGKGYGMPSSHAQFVAFWSVSLALFLLVRHRPYHNAAPTSGPKSHTSGTANTDLRSRQHVAGSGSQTSWSLSERLAISLAACGVAAATAWSRIYLDYHTTRQVIVGSVAGVLTALAWFVVTALLRQSGLLAWGLELPLAKAFRVRDLIITEDMCQAGWEKWVLKKATKSKTG